MFFFGKKDRRHELGSFQDQRHELANSPWPGCKFFPFFSFFHGMPTSLYFQVLFSIWKQKSLYTRSKSLDKGHQELGLPYQYYFGGGEERGRLPS
jgi:hypothetical protein